MYDQIPMRTTKIIHKEAKRSEHRELRRVPVLFLAQKSMI